MRNALIAAALATLALPAGATVLYKSVGANGVVSFSDRPPEDTDRYQEIPLSFAGQGQANGAAYVSSGASQPAVAVARFDELKSFDQAIAQANARIDAAESALAQARRPTWSPHEGLRLSGSRATPEDVARVEMHKRDVLLARQSLLETLKARSR